MYENEAERQFEKRKWEFLRDLDKVSKMLGEEQAKPEEEQLPPPSLLDAWDAYLGKIKSTIEAAETPDDLPAKIDRVSQLEAAVKENWPASNDLSEYLFIIEEQWSVFR